MPKNQNKKFLYCFTTLFFLLLLSSHIIVWWKRDWTNIKYRKRTEKYKIKSHEITNFSMGNYKRRTKTKNKQILCKMKQIFEIISLNIFDLSIFNFSSFHIYNILFWCPLSLDLLVRFQISYTQVILIRLFYILHLLYSFYSYESVDIEM